MQQDSFILSFLKSMLGERFAPVWDFVMAHSSEAFAVLGVWLAIYLIARYQLKKIKEQTVRFCITESKEILAKRPKLSSKNIYKEIYPKWEQEVKNWGRFIPHRLDFIPVRVTAENVLHKFEFNPEFLSEALKINGVELNEHKKK